MSCVARSTANAEDSPTAAADSSAARSVVAGGALGGRCERLRMIEASAAGEESRRKSGWAHVERESLRKEWAWSARVQLAYDECPKYFGMWILARRSGLSTMILEPSADQRTVSCTEVTS